MADELGEPDSRSRGWAGPLPRIAPRLGRGERGSAIVKARLEARDVTGGYPGATVFSDVSFSVESGELLTILGANGSGKSALLETLQGLLPAGSGVILLDGEPVQDLLPEARAERGMSLVSDRRRLWREMTVDEHLRVGAFRRCGPPRLAPPGPRVSRPLPRPAGATRRSTESPERRAGAAAGAGALWHVVAPGLAARRSSGRARRGHDRSCSRLDPWSGREGRRGHPDGPAHPLASRHRDEGHVPPGGSPHGACRRRRRPRRSARPSASVEASTATVSASTPNAVSQGTLQSRHD